MAPGVEAGRCAPAAAAGKGNIVGTEVLALPWLVMAMYWICPALTCAVAAPPVPPPPVKITVGFDV